MLPAIAAGPLSLTVTLQSLQSQEVFSTYGASALLMPGGSLQPAEREGAADGPEVFAQSMGGVSDQDIDKITRRNAMRHFHYDPFTALGGKENCTVGALRKAVEGHDVSLKSQRREDEKRSNAATAASELAKMASAATE
jgi:hypothetical protein